MLLEVPVIDVAPFRDGRARQAVADEVGRAVREIGFLVITGHGVAPELIAAVQRASTAFFDLPEAEKELFQRQCLKRKLYPDDIAKFTVFMASGSTDSVTFAVSPLYIPNTRSWYFDTSKLTISSLRVEGSSETSIDFMRSTR